jgi:hypothetical protein
MYLPDAGLMKSRNMQVLSELTNVISLKSLCCDGPNKEVYRRIVGYFFGCCTVTSRYNFINSKSVISRMLRVRQRNIFKSLVCRCICAAAEGVPSHVLGVWQVSNKLCYKNPVCSGVISQVIQVLANVSTTAFTMYLFIRSEICTFHFENI